MPIKKSMNMIVRAIIFICLSFYATIAYSNGSCDKNHITQIEEYLNNYDKVIIPFTQSSTKKLNEAQANGVLLIEKPSKFRVNYDKPHPLVITGGKNFVSIYDFDLEELSRVDSADNLFKFLLELNVNLQNSIIIESCKLANSDIELFVKHKQTEQKAKIIFNQNPIKLKEMIIPDDGNDIAKSSVRIAFSKEIRASNFDKALFLIRDVKLYGAPKRYSSEEIIKISAVK